jgi:hypothetical protein
MVFLERFGCEKGSCSSCPNWSIVFFALSIWITGPQSTNPKYLKNAKSEHLIGWSFLNLTNEIGLLRNQRFWLGANILRCLYNSNI